jgi:hypothetical protein
MEYETGKFLEQIIGRLETIEKNQGVIDKMLKDLLKKK